MQEPKTTLGFWVGTISGMVIGTFVGGIALIGQGVWNGGYAAGERSGQNKVLSRTIYIGSSKYEECGVEMPVVSRKA